jgi:hypothetical protein
MQKVLNGQDIVLALRLVSLGMSESRPTLEKIGSALEIGPSGVKGSLDRLQSARLADQERRPLLPQLDEFLVHGVQFSFPASAGPPVRGIPTAWGVEGLLPDYVSEGPVPVWRFGAGEVRGYALEPLSKRALLARGNDPVLYNLLALVDALRLGDARVRALATDRLQQMLSSSQSDL